MYQAKTAAAKAKIKFCGENALPVRTLLALLVLVQKYLLCFTSTKVLAFSQRAVGT